MKKILKNPFLLVASIGLIYGVAVSLMNIAMNAQPFYLLVFRTNNMGGLMMFMMMVGAITGACFALGLMRKKKHEGNLYEDDI